LNGVYSFGTGINDINSLFLGDFCDVPQINATSALGSLLLEVALRGFNVSCEVVRSSGLSISEEALGTRYF
jgi:hypothetical protein